jgi:hypothetical protein
LIRSLAAALLLLLVLAGPAAATTDPAALAQPANYSGLRLDRSWIARDTPKSVGVPGAWANIPIPDTVALETAIDSRWPSRTLSDQVALEVQNFARPDGSNTWINRTAYTPAIHTISYKQALRPVRYCYTYDAATHACQVPGWGWTLRNMLAGLSADGKTDLHGGVPVPDGVTGGAPGTDGEIVFYQPTYRSTNWPTSHMGREYELWQFRLNPDFDTARPEGGFNPRFMAASGGRWAPMSSSHLHSINNWWLPDVYKGDEGGAPDSERQEVGWHVTGSGLQLLSDVVSGEDCARGALNHAIGLELPATRYAVRWPASASDGWDDGLAVTEGMRLRFPSSLAMPAGLSRFGRMWFRGVQRYGLVIDDQTSSSVVTRVQLGSLQCLDLFDGRSPADQIRMMPFTKLVLLKAGNDSAPNP